MVDTDPDISTGKDTIALKQLGHNGDSHPGASGSVSTRYVLNVYTRFSGH